MADLLTDLDDLKREALAQLERAGSREELQTWHGDVLGHEKKGRFSDVMRRLGQLPPEDRARAGKSVNVTKQELLETFAARQAEVERRALEPSLEAERLDVTLPGRPVPRGRLHLATQTLRHDLRHLRRPGLPGLPQPRGRGRPVPTSSCSTCRRTTRRATCGTRSTRPRPACSCARTPRRGRSTSCASTCPRPIRVILPGMCYRYEQITAAQRDHVPPGRGPGGRRADHAWPT